MSRLTPVAGAGPVFGLERGPQEKLKIGLLVHRTRRSTENKLA